MSKGLDAKRTTKKKAQKTLLEKRSAKRAKKSGVGILGSHAPNP